MNEISWGTLWTFVGSAVALAMAFFYFRHLPNKRFAYEIVSSNRLLTVEEEVAGRAQVLFDGHVTNDVRHIVLRLANVGNVPIVASDFAQPVEVHTGASSKILSCAVVGTYPENLGAAVTLNGDHVVLVPLLLNKTDWLLLKLLVADYVKVSVEGRIVGVSKVLRMQQDSKRDMLGDVFAGLLILAFAVFFAVGARNATNNIVLVVCVALGLGSAFLAAILILTAWRRYQRTRGV